MQKHWKNLPKKNTLNRVLYSLKEGRKMDKIDLSREGLEVLARGKGALMLDPCYVREVCAMLAKKLLAEMDKPKVWNDAPESAVRLLIWYYDRNDCVIRKHTMLQRTISTPPEREIAEKAVEKLVAAYCGSIVDEERKDICDIIESAINEYKEKVK